MRRVPLWRLLIDRGIAPDRRSATAWALAGRVYVAGQRVEKAGWACDSEAAVEVKGLDERYVGRGGLKLEGALEDLGVDPAGVVALDAGASTGGFTDCLLQHDARLVYAVDVGYGQLAGRLRADPRVVCLERTNISDVPSGALDPPPTLITVDLSYLSLRRAIPIVARLLAPDEGELLCLVKPLFETGDRSARRSGVIADPAEYRRVLEGLGEWCGREGYAVLGLSCSRIRGSGGTVEFFLRIRPGARPPCRAGAGDEGGGGHTPDAGGLRAAVAEAVSRALAPGGQNSSS